MKNEESVKKYLQPNTFICKIRLWLPIVITTGKRFTTQTMTLRLTTTGLITALVLNAVANASGREG